MLQKCSPFFALACKKGAHIFQSCQEPWIFSVEWNFLHNIEEKLTFFENRIPGEKQRLFFLNGIKKFYKKPYQGCTVTVVMYLIGQRELIALLNQNKNKTNAQKMSPDPCIQNPSQCMKCSNSDNNTFIVVYYFIRCVVVRPSVNRPVCIWARVQATAF